MAGHHQANFFSGPLKGKLLKKVISGVVNKKMFADTKYDIYSFTETLDPVITPWEQHRFLDFQIIEHTSEYLEKLHLNLKRIIPAILKHGNLS